MQLSEWIDAAVERHDVSAEMTKQKITFCESMSEAVR
jgi:hypothetical protein